MKKSVFSFIALASIISSCAYNVELMNPKPNLDLVKSKEKIAVVIDSQILDAFNIPVQESSKSCQVKDWHTSLKNGFKNGFGSFYEIVNDKSEADLVLEINKTDIEFITTDYSPSDIGGSYKKAQIIYRSILKNKKGEILNTDADSALSKKSITTSIEVTSIVESAVETMYERLVKEMFKKR